MSMMASFIWKLEIPGRHEKNWFAFKLTHKKKKKKKKKKNDASTTIY